MTSALRRLVALLLTALLVGLIAPSPHASAAGTTTLSVSVSIVGDGTTSLNGTVWVWPAPYSQGNGYPMTGGSWSASLADGDYKIGVSLTAMDGHTRFAKAGVPGGVASRDAADVLTLDGTPVDLAFALDQIATLQGTVTNGDGDPMAGLTVLRSRLGSGTSTTTDSTGHYTFGYVQAGQTAISVHPSGGWAGARQQIEVDGTTDYTVDLLMETPAAVEGTVTDAETGMPIPWLYVSAFQRIGSSGFYQNSTRTDASGHYLLEGIAPGETVVQYNDDFGGYPLAFNGGGSLLSLAPALTTTAGTTLTHDEQLTQNPDDTAGMALSGAVTASAPSDLLVGVEVRAWAADGSWAGSDLTDWKGRWGIDVPAGTYTVGIRSGSTLLGVDGETPWFPAYYPDAWQHSAATPITVVDDTDTHPGLDVPLERSAVVTVDVRGPGGTTDLDAGYTVAAVGGATAYDEPAVSGSGNVLEVLLRPGTWNLRLSGQRTTGAALLPQWYGGSGATSGSATPVTVAAGDEIQGGTVTLPARLAPTTAPRIRGKAKVGKRLTATKGTWNLMTGTTFTFTWKRGTKVVGHKSGYQVARADRGKKLKVTVTATNGSFSTTRTLTVKVAS